MGWWGYKEERGGVQTEDVNRAMANEDTTMGLGALQGGVSYLSVL